MSKEYVRSFPARHISPVREVVTACFVTGHWWALGMQLRLGIDEGSSFKVAA